MLPASLHSCSGASQLLPISHDFSKVRPSSVRSLSPLSFSLSIVRFCDTCIALPPHLLWELRTISKIGSDSYTDHLANIFVMPWNTTKDCSQHWPFFYFFSTSFMVKNCCRRLSYSYSIFKHWHCHFIWTKPDVDDSGSSSLDILSCLRTLTNIKQH